LKQAFDFTGSPIYDMDVTILTKPEEILARSWTFARKQIETAKFHRFQLLNDNNVQWRSFCLLVPVEPELETIAKRLIARRKILFLIIMPEMIRRRASYCESMVSKLCSISSRMKI